MNTDHANMISGADDDVRGFGGKGGGSGEIQFRFELGLSALQSGVPTATISRVGTGSKPGGAGDGNG